MDALESALEDARSAARSKEQKLVIATKEMKASLLWTLCVPARESSIVVESTDSCVQCSFTMSR